MRTAAAWLAILALGLCGRAAAHVFPQEQVPGAGARLERAPAAVRVRFDAALSAHGCALHVEDERGRPVSGTSRVDPTDSAALLAPLPELPPGRYRVRWRAAGRDGDPVQGDYGFVVDGHPTAR